MGREIVMVRLTPEADESQLFFSSEVSVALQGCRDEDCRWQVRNKAEECIFQVVSKALAGE